jgi:hypothetical protein
VIFFNGIDNLPFVIGILRMTVTRAEAFSDRIPYVLLKGHTV